MSISRAKGLIFVVPYAWSFEVGFGFLEKLSIHDLYCIPKHGHGFNICCETPNVKSCTF
jgi:hypothetical protein